MPKSTLSSSSSSCSSSNSYVNISLHSDRSRPAWNDDLLQEIILKNKRQQRRSRPYARATSGDEILFLRQITLLLTKVQWKTLQKQLRRCAIQYEIYATMKIDSGQLCIKLIVDQFRLALSLVSVLKGRWSSSEKDATTGKEKNQSSNIRVHHRSVMVVPRGSVWTGSYEYRKRQQDLDKWVCKQHADQLQSTFISSHGTTFREFARVRKVVHSLFDSHRRGGRGLAETKHPNHIARRYFAQLPASPCWQKSRATEESILLRSSTAR